MRLLTIFLCLTFSLVARLSVITEARAGVMHVAQPSTNLHYSAAIKATDSKHQVRGNERYDSTISFCRYGAHSLTTGGTRSLDFSFYLPSFACQYPTARSIAALGTQYHPILGIFASYIRCLLYPKHSFW